MIDLRSDFLAHGTPAMTEAWARAAREPYRFGLREDPHQAALERRIADMTAHEDALVFPTCTMANLVEIMLNATRGTRVLTHEGAHVITSEACGAAAFAGVQLVPLVGDPQSNQPEQWRTAATEGDAQKPATSLFVLENTHNRAAGLPLPLSYTTAVLAIARERGIRTHLDGSRLFHAAAALGTTIDALARGFDTVSLSLNKGFGAPIAAALAGSRSSIEQAVILRQRLGGGIRPHGPRRRGNACSARRPGAFRAGAKPRNAPRTRPHRHCGPACRDAQPIDEHRRRRAHRPWRCRGGNAAAARRARTSRAAVRSGPIAHGDVPRHNRGRHRPRRGDRARHAGGRMKPGRNDR